MRGNGTRTRRTPKKARASFLASLAEQGNVSAACRICGVGRRTVYEWRQSDAAFAAAWDDALEEAADALEAEARRRAIAGERPSDTLLIFLLKSLRPERFDDTARLRGLEAAQATDRDRPQYNLNVTLGSLSTQELETVVRVLGDPSLKPLQRLLVPLLDSGQLLVAAEKQA